MKFFRTSYRFAFAYIVPVAIVAVFIGSTGFTLTNITPAAYAAGTISVWWPTDGSHVSGTQPFKAVLQGQSVSTYTMYWQVDGGQLNQMPINNTDSPHTEATVGLSGWNWEPSGEYLINFVAKDSSGNILSSQAVHLYLPVSSSTPATPATVSSPAATSSATTTPALFSTPTTATVSTDPFYVNPNSYAATQAAAWKTSNPTGAAAMQTLADQPTATWFGDWNTNIQSAVSAVVQAANAEKKIPVLVAYTIPDLDCGGYSADSTTDAGYIPWITSFANGISSNQAIVILEPDALADLSCLSAGEQTTRKSLLAQAVIILKKNPQTKVYLDAGHENWIAPATMATYLQGAAISQADGFSLNVSNFYSTNSEITYGSTLSTLLGGKHFIIDTSRNGTGSNNGQWCNPAGAAIGTTPTTSTGNPLVDAFLWIKTPGESDGTCNGGPTAGAWWPSSALQLVQNAL